MLSRADLQYLVFMAIMISKDFSILYDSKVEKLFSDFENSCCGMIFAEKRSSPILYAPAAS